jgi:hypothetical protein
MFLEDILPAVPGHKLLCWDRLSWLGHQDRRESLAVKRVLGSFRIARAGINDEVAGGIILVCGGEPNGVLSIERNHNGKQSPLQVA